MTMNEMSFSASDQNDPSCVYIDSVVDAVKRYASDTIIPDLPDELERPTPTSLLVLQTTKTPSELISQLFGESTSRRHVHTSLEQTSAARVYQAPEWIWLDLCESGEAYLSDEEWRPSPASTEVLNALCQYPHLADDLRTRRQTLTLPGCRVSYSSNIGEYVPEIVFDHSSYGMRQCAEYIEKFDAFDDDQLYLRSEDNRLTPAVWQI